MNEKELPFVYERGWSGIDAARMGERGRVSSGAHQEPTIS